MRGRSAVPWIALALVLLGVAVLVGRPTGRSNRPYDPGANGPRGAKALVVLLDELGADVVVDRGAPGDDATTAILLRDRFDEDDDERDLDDLRDWVEDGGILVVADPSASILDDLDGAPQPCPVALDAVDVVGPVSGGAERTVARGDDCFGGLVSATTLGAGTVVAVAEPDLFTNDHLGEHDNAVLAANLLAPTASERVAFVQGPVAAGDTALLDLIGPRVAQALGQLAIAFGVLVLFVGRRLGRPVVEPQPVSIAGSELVTAVGRMYGARKHPAEAAHRVRADTKRALERRLGLRSDTPPEHLADAVANRTGLDPGMVVGALAHRPVTTDADLVAVLTDLDRIRDLTLGAPASAGATNATNVNATNANATNANAPGGTP